MSNQDTRNRISEHLQSSRMLVSTASKTLDHAIAVKDVLPVLTHYTLDAVACIEVSCFDYDVFRGLPSVVSFMGREYCRTGWNSDSGRAFYKTGAIARKVR